MLRSIFRSTLFVVVLMALWATVSVDQAAAQAVPPGQKVACKWGKVQKLDAIPGCGVPLILNVGSPAGVGRLMFARDDNPTLKRYMYRSRAIGAPVKAFKRMVNVSKTDIVLCPSDFQKARILAFRVVKGKVIISRPTCEVGPPGAAAIAPGMTAAMSTSVMIPAMNDGGMTPATSDGGMIPAMRDGGMTGRSVTAAIERDSPVRQRDLVKLRRSLKMDSLARLLGLLGLLLGLGATVGVVLLALTVRRRLGRLEERGTGGAEGKNSDA